MHEQRRIHRSGDDHWGHSVTASVVIVDDEDQLIDTGVLDHYGKPILRRAIRRPVGFMRRAPVNV